MIVRGSFRWNLGIGRAKGDVEQDEEGLKTVSTVGQSGKQSPVIDTR